MKIYKLNKIFANSAYLFANYAKVAYTIIIMQPEEFKKWRKSLGLSQKNAAEMLGLKIRIIQYYEKGKKGKKTINIPKYIQLACLALEIQHKINKI